MEHVIHELRLQGAGNEKGVCLAGPGNETWQIRLDYEGRDAEIGFGFYHGHMRETRQLQGRVGQAQGSDFKN